MFKIYDFSYFEIVFVLLTKIITFYIQVSTVEFRISSFK